MGVTTSAIRINLLLVAHVKDAVINQSLAASSVASEIYLFLALWLSTWIDWSFVVCAAVAWADQSLAVSTAAVVMD